MIILDFKSIYASVTIKGDIDEREIVINNIDHVKIVDKTVKSIITMILCLDKHKNIRSDFDEMEYRRINR